MPTDELLMALESVLQNHPKEHHQKVIDLFRMLVNQRHSRNRTEKEVNPEDV